MNKTPTTRGTTGDRGSTPVQQLIELGSEIYGAHWINPTSRDLGIAHRTIAAWVSGKRTFHDGPILDAMKLLAKSHQEAVAKARDIINQGRV